MPTTHEQALSEIEATLAVQNERFAAFIEAFSELPPDMRIDVNPKLLDAIAATTSELPPAKDNIQPTLGALRV